MPTSTGTRRTNSPLPERVTADAGRISTACPRRPTRSAPRIHFFTHHVNQSAGKWLLGNSRAARCFTQ